MSPSNNVGMELPPPVNEQLPPAALPEQLDNKPEQQVASPIETLGASANQPLATAPPPPIIPISTTTPPLTPSASTDDDAQASDLAADDGDLIEKEWVNKAKTIVERTKHDPYKQSEELTLLKADYLQKRYNKTLKQSS